MSHPLVERIKRDGGVEVDLGGGRSGFVSLELRNEEVFVTQEGPTQKEVDTTGGLTKKGLTSEVAGKISGVKSEVVEKKKAIFIDDADRNFKAAFPKRDRFARDLSDAPPEMRASLMATYELLQQQKPDELNDGERKALVKLKPIMDAIGYIPPPKAVDRAAVELLRMQEIQGAEAARVRGRQLAAEKKAAKKPPATSKSVPGAIGPRPSQDFRQRESRAESDEFFERFVKSSYWLVTDDSSARGGIVAVKVAPWWPKERGKGKPLGLKVLDTYTSRGHINPFALEDIIQIDNIDGNVSLGERTRGEFEHQKAVPSSLRSEANAAKISLLIAQDTIAPDVRYGSAQPKTKPGAGVQAK